MTALIIIDVQSAFDDPVWGRRNNPDAEERIAALLAAWRARRDPIFHVKHNSSAPNSTLNPANAGNAIKPIVAPLPTEPLFEKTVNSAFIGTDLEARLHRAGVAKLAIVGLTTPHCVSTTARMAANLGFDVVVAGDATAAFEWRAHDGAMVTAEDVHYHALAALHGEFATIVTSADLLQ